MSLKTVNVFLNTDTSKVAVGRLAYVGGTTQSYTQGLEIAKNTIKMIEKILKK